VKRATVCITLLVGLALACGALAGEKKKRAKPERATGAFVSATVEGGTCTWKIAVDEAGEKTFAMAGQVAVMYSEKNGAQRVRMIRVAGKKPPKAKGNMQVATGDLVSVAKEGKSVVAKIKTADGEKDFMLTERLGVMYREADGAATAMAVTAAGRQKGKDGEKKRGEGRKKKNKDGGAPENL